MVERRELAGAGRVVEGGQAAVGIEGNHRERRRRRAAAEVGEDGLEDLADWKAVLAVTDPVDESRECAKAVGILGVDRLGVEGRPEGAVEGARLVRLRARLQGEQRQRIQADAGEWRAER